jgi:hypothetical protein
MVERIFIRSADALVALTPEPYGSEDALQALLAEHLDLIPGDEIDTAFFNALRERAGEPGVRLGRALLQWAHQKASVSWGRGNKSGSFAVRIDHLGKDHLLFYVATYGRIELSFQWLKTTSAFADSERRLELLKRVNHAIGTTFAPEAIERRPSFDIQELDRPGALPAFLSIMDWVIDTIQHQPP